MRCEIGVQGAQLCPQRLRHGAHPVAAHGIGHLHLAHHGLQGLQEHFGPQWVAFGVDAGQALRGAGQTVELCQRGIDGFGQHLAGTGAFHAFVDLVFVHQLQFVEMHREQGARVLVPVQRVLGHGLAQCAGVALGHGEAQARELLACFEQAVAFAGCARTVFQRLQRQSGAFEHPFQQSVALVQGVPYGVLKHLGVGSCHGRSVVSQAVSSHCGWRVG